METADGRADIENWGWFKNPNVFSNVPNQAHSRLLHKLDEQEDIT